MPVVPTGGRIPECRYNSKMSATPLIASAKRLSGRCIAAQCNGGERLITTQAGLVTAASFRI